MQKSELEAITHYFQEKGQFVGSPQETKILDNFIAKHKSYNFKLEQATQMINFIQKAVAQKQIHIKPLQLLRLLTKPLELRAHLKPEFLEKINEILPEMTSQPNIIVQILAIHLRYIEMQPKLITHDMFSTILDLLVMNNPEVNRVIIQITKQLSVHGVNQVLQQVWYIGRLLFALQRVQMSSKPKLVNLIRQLLDLKNFNENFRRINGVTTLISELRRCGNNMVLKVSLLNCIYRLLLTTKTQAIYDFKLANFTAIINLKIRQPLNYIQMILNIKILTHLMLDNDISSKFIEEGIYDVIALLVRAHPTNCHLIKFEDIDDNDEVQALEQLKLLLLRLLRYISSLQRNRKIFKQIFPNQLLGPFIDVGHFIKPLKQYMNALHVYDKLDNNKVLAIQDQYEKLQKLFANKNFKLLVVGSYNLVEQLGQGAFGSVFLAKKGSNQYALKRIKIDETTTGRENIQQLSRQVKIYKNLKHPNIVKFYQSFVDQGHLYIVMQVIKGCNMAQLIRNQNQKSNLFEEAVIWKFVICLLSVLRYLHIEKKILHRDLNPSNIMIDHKLNLKVTDFGLAKSIHSAPNMTQSFVGTVAYSAPQIVKRQDYNQKADIWSLGCIIHQLMCLKPAFTGNNPLLLAKVISSRQFNCQLPQQYSQQLRNFVKLCFISDQKQRPSITDLLKLIVDKLVEYSDQLKQKQTTLSDQILQLSKKINTGGFGATHTRMFGGSLYNSHQGPALKNKISSHIPPQEQALRQTQIVKIDSQVLNKIGEDPMSKFVDIIRKLSLIASTQTSLKKNFKKYIIDTFYNRIMISDEFSLTQSKNQLNKLINLSKEQVSFLGVKFQLNQNYVKSISYQMLYFYVQELYQLIKK